MSPHTPAAEDLSPLFGPALLDRSRSQSALRWPLRLCLPYQETMGSTSRVQNMHTEASTGMKLLQ